VKRLVVLTALLASACAAPQQVTGSNDVTRPNVARHSAEEAFGHQISLTTYADGLYQGELVACDDTFVYLHLNGIRIQSGVNPFSMMPWREVTKVAVHTRSSGKDVIIVWTVLGGLSTIPQGVFLPIGALGWSVVSPLSIVWAASHGAVHGQCGAISPYARYPAGLPPVMLPVYLGPAPAFEHEESAP
jgi:hypothetical protein